MGSFGSGRIGQSLLVQQYHIYQGDGMICGMGGLEYWNLLHVYCEGN